MSKYQSRFVRVVVAVVPLSLLTTLPLGAAPSEAPVAVSVKAPMVCSHGPSDSAYSGVLTVPRSAPSGSTFAVRVDSRSSGQISHFGLNYIFDMTTDYPLPAGTSYVDGSARVIPGTGTANARAGARVWHDAKGIHFVLPAHVENGSSYTPPSIEFALKVTAPAGGDVAIKFAHYEVTANAFLVGNVHTFCDPSPKPYALAAVHIGPAAP